MELKKAAIYLEDGTRLEGKSFGSNVTQGGEIVFHTGMTGYQEILTDPSYCGQIVVMTYPHIGNYGIHGADNESSSVHLSGFVVGDYPQKHKQWRSETSLHQFLMDHNIPGIFDVDTRMLTRKIRDRGSMRALISCEDLDTAKKKLSQVPSMEGQNLIHQVACKEPYVWENRTSQTHPITIVVVDCGIKWNILRSFDQLGVRCVVVPPLITAEAILSYKPNGLFLSNGPGDPAAVEGLPSVVEQLFGKMPIFGICLGHQMLALALGAKTFKLPFGHHGANHPVRNESNQKIEITSQNHGFAVERESLEKAAVSKNIDLRISHIHLTDDTVEGFELPGLNVKAIQYHPEACPGPHDSAYLFKEFVACLKTK
ncbi:MAG: glutamine-hydrolyzing carbamoyl-phosphate synthase small subunit [Bdellovibrionota bacterium]